MGCICQPWLKWSPQLYALHSRVGEKRNFSTAEEIGNATSEASDRLQLADKDITGIKNDTREATKYGALEFASLTLDRGCLCMWNVCAVLSRPGLDTTTIPSILLHTVLMEVL